MNKNTRKELNSVVQDLLIKNGIISEVTPEVLPKIDMVVLGLDEFMYSMLNKKVPYNHVVEIWKKYNLAGGYTVKQLSEYYNLSITTITDIIKDKYY